MANYLLLSWQEVTDVMGLDRECDSQSKSQQSWTGRVLATADDGWKLDSRQTQTPQTLLSLSSFARWLRFVACLD